MKERVLLIGGGGREHALARALRRSASCEQLWCAPGNPGIERVAEVVRVDVTRHDAVVDFCTRQQVTLVVVGPEIPLAAGLSDDLRAAGYDVFGPSRSAARIETSKGFAKDLMARHDIPTAPYRRFASTERVAAMEYAAQHATPVVVKYDGLAAGKGVVVAMTTDEAVTAVNDMFQGAYGDDGVVIEGFLEGHEASLFAITDGTRHVLLAPSQDHKRVGDGDTGKNTGGMGSYAPAPLVTADVLQWADEHIIRPTLAAMHHEGVPFVGCLFAGLMVHDDGTSSVVEFNCRFGDPETQTVMTVFDGDAAKLFASAARGALDPSAIISVALGSAVTVVLASAGYPDAFDKGAVIDGIVDAETDAHVIVYHAGTVWTDASHSDVATSGGRVLGVTAVAATLAEARDRAYAACEKIRYATKYNRTDIASKGLMSREPRNS